VRDTRESQPSMMSTIDEQNPRLLTNLMGICSHRNPERASKAEVSQFEVVPFVNEEVLWLKIAMEDAMGMTVEETGIQLICKFLQ